MNANFLLYLAAFLTTAWGVVHLFPMPVWFHALPGSQGDFGAIVAVMSASDSAGASAASGGGASGAG